MKLVLILLMCLTASYQAAVVSEDTPEAKQLQKVEFSEKARYLLKEASLRAAAFLCFGEKADSEIYDTICRKVIMKTDRPGAFTENHLSNCMDCEVADPICWDACPQ